MLNRAKIKILLIEDEEYDIRRVRNTVKPFHDRMSIENIVSDGRAALELIEEGHAFDVIIMDFQISGGLKGEALIRKIKELDQTLQIIVITKMTMNVTDYEFANKLLEAGAMWYCTKYPGDIEDYIYQPTDFILSIYNAYEKKKLQAEKNSSNVRLQKNAQDTLAKKHIIGDSSATRHLRAQIEQCAKTHANVLVIGRSGTGKELVATNIHYLSDRRLESFVPVNCGSLPGHLVESELFGFEKGAFTGANSKKQGLFEVANKGTIFLDEISELPLAAQAKLLRVIQEGELDKIGRTEKIQVDVRVIAASNKDLLREVHEKRFREDLYYRLNVFRIEVPALRSNRDDIPLLVYHFLEKYCADMRCQRPIIEEEAMAVFLDFDWPGNVRQLQNVVQRLLFTGKERINARLAKDALGLLRENVTATNSLDIDRWFGDGIKSWREMERLFQEEYFRYVRENTNSDAEAARLLGLAPPNYHRMCKKLGLK